MPAGRAIGCEPAALYRLFRGAYRAGRHARGDRQAHRRRRGDHRQLELLGHRHRRAEPCRHDRDAPPQGRRRRAGAPRRAHPRPLRRNRRDPRTVWTIGRILIDPNAPSIVPGRAEMQVQFRDTDTAILARFEQALHELVAEADRAGPCAVAIAPISKSEPAPDGPRISARDRERGRASRAGPAHADAERRRARRADPGPPDALGDDVRAEHQRRQPSLVRGHERRGHHARRAGFRRRRGGDPARRGERHGRCHSGIAARAVLRAVLRRAGARGLRARKGSRCALSARRRRGGRPTGCSTAPSMSPGAGRCGSTRCTRSAPDCDLVCFAEAVTRDPFMLIGRTPQPDFRLESLRDGADRHGQRGADPVALPAGGSAPRRDRPRRR